MEVESTVELLIRAAAIAERHLTRALRDHGITYPQFNLLQELRLLGASQIGDLAEQAGSKHSNLTSMLDRLERGGLIERERALHDRRAIVISFTPLGEQRLQEAEATVRAASKEIPATVTAFLGDLIQGLNKEGAA